MPTNQQRREAERRRLQQQLEERRAREAARKRTTLITSIIGTLVLIGVIIGIVVATSGGSGKKGTAQDAGGKDTVSSPAVPTTSAPPISTPTAPCAKPPTGTTASLQGVTVAGAKDLAHAPTVKSLSQQAPKTLQCEDLIVGTGKPATPTSSVSVQYIGVLYKNGTQFDSSWSNGGQPAQFSLTQVIPGFTQGIGGAGKVAPMREGGRRIMILPSSLAYAGRPPPNSNIPVDAPLVFVVDLKSVSG